MKKELEKRLRKIKLTKRQEFVVISLGLTFGLIAVQLVPAVFRFWFLIALTTASYFLSALGLRENLKGVEWLTLLALPTLFTASLGLFYFLLPIRWLTRLPTALLYAVGIYAILLVENIYNVASERTIQLLRVGHAVGFLATLTTVFLFLNTIFSFHFNAILNFVLTFIIVFPLSLQSLWSVKLEQGIGENVILYSLFFSLLLAQSAFMISFWPTKPILASLFLTAFLYTLLGIGQQYFARRLFRKNIIEHLRVFIIVFILILLTTKYR